MATFQYGSPGIVPLTVAEAATRLRLSWREVRALFDAGVLGGRMGLSESGRSIVPRISPNSVQDYQEEHSNG